MPEDLRHHVLNSMINQLELVSCPPLTQGGLAGAIRARGNVPVTVGDGCMFELTPDEIRETWGTTSTIKTQVAGAMVQEISHRLCTELKDGDEDEGLIASEAAACLFLALRHHDLPLTQALQGCRIVWDDRARIETVEYLA